MKKIFCSDTTCAHNENINIGFTSMLVCARCDDVIVNTWHDRCDGYENIENYLDRINTY